VIHLPSAFGGGAVSAQRNPVWHSEVSGVDFMRVPG
jgi:hypothetical protein